MSGNTPVGVRCPNAVVNVASEAKELEFLNTTGVFFDVSMIKGYD